MTGRLIKTFNLAYTNTIYKALQLHDEATSKGTQSVEAEGQQARNTRRSIQACETSHLQR